MHAKILASLLLVTCIGTSFARSVSMLYQPQGDNGLSRQAKAVTGPDRMLRSGNGRLVQREWPGHLSLDQKHLISQFLPHLYAGELAARENNLQDADTHFPSWMDFGRRSSEDVGEDV
nr:gastrin/cholecystokinin-like peptide [Pogona vitticeps]